MSGCLKYGKKIYKPEILIKKIRENAKFFIKKHGITSEDIAKVMNPAHKKERDNNIQYSFLKESDFDSDGNVKPEVLAEIEAEKQIIISEAKANGTYLKAPNGKDTNLTEEQWVLTRTKRFKEWFGDWEIMQKKTDIIHIDSQFSNIRDAKAFAKENLQGKIFINKDTGEKINVSRTSIDKTFSGKAFGQSNNQSAHIQAISQLGKILENSILIENYPDRNNDPSIEGIQRFYGVINYDGDTYKVKTTVKKVKNEGNRYYTYEIQETELIKENDGQFRTVREGDNQSPNSANPSSSVSIANILQNSLDSKGKPFNVEYSKVVDENGEPKVMYHGTSNKFNVFNTEKQRDGWLGKGFYFTENKDFAKTFGRNIKEVFVKLQNPFQVQGNSPSDIITEIKKEYSKETELFDITDIKKVLIAEGKDGLIFNHWDNGLTISVFTSNQIKSATDNVGIFSNENPDIRFQIIGEQGAANLDQKEESNFRMNNLAVAKEMEEAGKTAKEIWIATGWERGVDGKWRYEIQDLSSLDLKPIDLANESVNGKIWIDNEITLGELFHDNDLFKAYPELRDIKLGFVYFDDIRTTGQYHSDSKTIFLPKQSLGQVFLFDKDTADTLKSRKAQEKEEFAKGVKNFLDYISESKKIYATGKEGFNIKFGNVAETIVHEIQHVIQDIEGFAKGGNWLAFRDITARDQANKLAKEANNIFDKQSEEWKNKVRAINRAKIDQDFDLVEELESELEDDIAYKEYDDLNFDALLLMEDPDEVITTAFEQYQNLTGETEARNVSARLKTPESERKTIPLSETEDVSRSNQIVKMSIDGVMLQQQDNLLPSSLLKELSNVLRTEGVDAAMNTLTETDWYKKEPQSRKDKISQDGIVQFILDQALKHKENLKNRVKEKETEVKEVKADMKKKIADIKSSYKDKIDKLKQLNTDIKTKVKLRTQAQREVGEDLKQYILSNPLSNKLTPAQTTRLIRLASEVSMPKSRVEAVYNALDKFQKVYDEIRERAEMQKTEKQTKQEAYTDVKNGLDQGKTPEEMRSEEKKKIAERIMERKAAQSADKGKGFDIQEEAFNKSEETIKKNKPKVTLRKLIEKFTDRQFVPKKLLEETGMDNTYNRFINNNGSSGRAKEWMDKLEDKVFKGIYGEDYRNLNKIIDARATISIDQYREKEGLPPIDHHNGFNQYYAQDALNILREKIGDEKFNELNKRADEYFKQHHEMIDRLLENGLISKDTADVLKSREYSPRFYLEHMKDYEGDIDKQHSEIFKSGTAGLSQGAVKSLDEGSKGEKVNDTSFLMNNYMRKMSKMLSVNEMNRTFMEREYPKAKERYEQLKDKDNPTKEEQRFIKYFKELQSKVIENPIIGVTENGNLKYEHDTAPQGYSKNYYYVDGVKHEFFLADELHNQWNDVMDGFMGKGMKEVAPYVSGSAAVKFFATGNNPGFFISNTPRDFFHSIITSDQYSNFLPLSILQMAKDSYKGIKEAFKHDYGKTNGEGLMDKYIQYGGMMDFLSQQGMIKEESFINRATRYAVGDKGRDVLGNILSFATLKKLNSYSETMFRIAIMDRTLKNQLKDYNKQKETSYRNIEEIEDSQVKDDMYYRAVREARSVLDFNQGGTWTKDMESFMPYLNAATQGARTITDALRKNPIGTTMKIMQAVAIPASMFTGLSMLLISQLKDDEDKDKSAIDIYLEAMEGINSNVRSSNFIIVLPTKDENGNYQIVTIPKTQEILPIATLYDYAIENQMREISGKKKLSADFILSRANQSLDGALPINPLHNPIGENSQAYEIAAMNPIVKGLMATVLGVNAFTKRKVNPDVGKTLVKNEGMGDTRIEGFYKTLAPIADMSPARTKVFVEGFITQPTTNPYIGLIYGGLDYATGNGDTEKLAKDIYTSLSKRVYRSTSTFNRKQNLEEMNSSEIEEAKERADKMYNDAKSVADILVENELSGGEAKKRAVSELRNMGYEDNDIKKMMKNISRMYKYKKAGAESSGKYDNYLYEIKNTKSAKEKAALMKTYFGNEVPKEAIKRAKQIGGVFTKDAISEYRRIREN